MKKLTYIILALLMIGITGCKRSQADRYQRYLEEKDDTTFEYIQQPRDSVDLDEGGDVGAFADDDGLIAVPDIPKERPLRMEADDYEVEKVMRGR